MVFRTQITDARVTQPGHGLAVGDVLRLNGSLYVKALADTVNNSRVVGICSCVVGDIFDVHSAGMVEGLPAIFTPGTVYFLSDSTPGLLQTTAGAVEMPLFIADAVDSGYFQVTKIATTIIGGPLMPDKVVLLSQTIDAGVSDGDPVWFDTSSSTWYEATSVSPKPTGIHLATQVTLFGTRPGLLGLIPGTFYYMHVTGGLSASPASGVKIGYSVSATELLVDIDFEVPPAIFLYNQQVFVTPPVVVSFYDFFDVPLSNSEIVTINGLVARPIIDYTLVPIVGGTRLLFDVSVDLDQDDVIIIKYAYYVPLPIIFIYEIFTVVSISIVEYDTADPVYPESQVVCLNGQVMAQGVGFDYTIAPIPGGSRITMLRTLAVGDIIQVHYAHN